MKSLQGVAHSARDLFTRLLPDRSDPHEYGFAFLVHPRGMRDVYRKYPFLRFLPSKLLEKLLRWYWPVLLSPVTGLVSRKTGKPIRGFVLTISLTAREMLQNRALALRKIKQATVLARKSGAKIIGLGGLTSSLSRGGLDLVHDAGICVTTGHAYTAHTVAQTLLKLARILQTGKETLLAFVGAAGSVGSTTAHILAREGYTHFLLVDLPHKQHIFPRLIADLQRLNPQVRISTSHRVADIHNADFIIATTNAPEAVIQSKDLKRGAVVVDDAQPSDVAPEVLKNPEVLVVEAGIVHTPHIHNHFNFNLKDRFDNFCCLAEVLILATREWDKHYVLNRPTLDLVDRVAAWGNDLGFRVAEFQNFNESITAEHLERIKKIIHEQHDLQS